MASSKALLAATLAAVALASTACGSPNAAHEAGGGAASSGASDSASTAKALGVDLAKCGSDPTAKLGIDVKVGQTFAMSGGPATAFAPVGAGVKAGFQSFNDTGNFRTKFNLIQADDAFAPDKALTATQQLIDKDKVSAMAVTIGTPQVLAVRPLLNAECVPMLSGQAGGASANAPAKFPWTVPFTLPSTVDARIWVENIVAKYPDGAKVAMFHSNDSPGKQFFEAVKKYMAGTKSTIVSEQTIENTDAAAPASQVTSMRSSGASVLIAAPTGSGCASLMKEVAGQGWKPTFYISSQCQATLFDAAGTAANGVLVNGIIKDPTRAPYNNDPDVVAAVAQLRKFAPSAPVNYSTILGMMYASPFFAASKQAAASPLGLSRLGILQAATHMTFQPPLALPGVKYQLDYPKDQVAMEAAQLQQYDAASKTFTKVKLYDFEGQMTGVASS